MKGTPPFNVPQDLGSKGGGSSSSLAVDGKRICRKVKTAKGPWRETQPSGYCIGLVEDVDVPDSTRPIVLLQRLFLHPAHYFCTDDRLWFSVAPCPWRPLVSAQPLSRTPRTFVPGSPPTFPPLSSRNEFLISAFVPKHGVFLGSALFTVLLDVGSSRERKEHG